jgi:hypothetical protein
MLQITIYLCYNLIYQYYTLEKIKFMLKRMLYIYELWNIIDLLYNYFSLEIIYYMSKKIK